ncbi:2516_t:CDS:1, partial [Paraglomus occultum]
ITGNILKDKANYFAAKLSINNFHASEGWLTGFKHRLGLRQFRKQGEAASAPSFEQLENERFYLQTLLSVYNPEDIWNGDEPVFSGNGALSRGSYEII